jgi:hypothetical protein
VSKSKFPGFSLPKDTFLPPEFWDVLPGIKTMSELKVLLVVLREYFRAGLDAQPLPVDRIQLLSGLARKSATDGLQRARVCGTIIRRRMGGTYGYEPRLREAAQANERDSSGSEPPCMHESSHDLSSAFSSDEHDHALEFKNSQQLRREVYRVLVVEFGVACRVADDIATKRDPNYCLKHIEYARYEVQTGFSPDKPAGYIVARIRDDRPAPLGYEEGKVWPDGVKRWYTPEEFEKYFEH